MVSDTAYICATMSGPAPVSAGNRETSGTCPAQAVLLAAGLGKRMRELTRHLPKPLIRLHGKPLIEHHIPKLVQVGVERIVINHSCLGHMIEEAIGDGRRFDVEIVYSAEGEQPLETAGGIVKALAHLQASPFLVVNSDIYTDFDFSGFQLSDTALAQLVMVANPEHNPQGDFSLVGSRLGNGRRSRRCYAGIGVYRPELFAHLPPGHRPLLPLLRQAAEAGRLEGRLHAGRWMDIGTPERLRQAEQLVIRGRPGTVFAASEQR